MATTMNNNWNRLGYLEPLPMPQEDYRVGTPTYSPATGYGARGSGYETGYQPTTYGTPYQQSTPRTSQDDDTWRYGSPGDVRRSRFPGTAVGRQSGGSSGSRSSSTGSTITRTYYTEPKPEMYDVPELNLPQMDKRKIRALQQQAAAPGVRTLREALNVAMGEYSPNPNVRRMTVREALKGYGTGLENVMAGAGQQARSEHMADIQQQSQQEMQNWQAKLKAQQDAYNAAMQAYLNSRTTVTEQANNASTNPLDMYYGGGGHVVGTQGTPMAGPRRYGYA